MFQHLGDSVEALQQLADGSHPFSASLSSAKAPVVIVGSEALQRSDGAAIMALVQQISNKAREGVENEEWKVLNVMHRVASQVPHVIQLKRTTHLLF